MNSSKLFFDFKSLSDYIQERKPNLVGMWALGTKVHDAHRNINFLVRQKCDFVFGCYVNNWHAMLHDLFNIKEPHDHPLYQTTIDEMCERSDAVVIQTGINFGYTQDEKTTLIQKVVDELPDKDLPKFIIDDKQLWTSLRAAQIYKVLQHRYVKYNYQVGGGKDAWRPYFVQWLSKYYPWLKYEIIEPIVNEHGNSISSGMPKDLESKINKPLLLPSMRNIEEARNNVKDLGLEVDMFCFDEQHNRIYARFSYHGEWWNYGIKI